MDSALIITNTEKSADYYVDILNSASINKIVTLSSCGDARRLLVEQSFDLVLINAPLKDETGENLSRYIASKGLAQVILTVKMEYFEAVSSVCENDGVLTVSRPINRSLLWAALMLAKSAQNRLQRVRQENDILKQKIEDIRIVDRAKWILVSNMNMTEKEAHRYIEKQAMDLRSTRRSVAERILKTYEN